MSVSRRTRVGYSLRFDLCGGEPIVKRAHRRRAMIDRYDADHVPAVLRSAQRGHLFEERRQDGEQP